MTNWLEMRYLLPISVYIIIEVKENSQGRI